MSYGTLINLPKLKISFMISEGECQNMRTDCSRLCRLLNSSRQSADTVPQLTQLVRVSPVPVESPNATVPCCAASVGPPEARIVPESRVCCALSLSFDALTLTLSATLTAPTTKRTPRTFQTIYAHCPLLLMPAGWQAILRGLLSGGSTQ